MLTALPIPQQPSPVAVPARGTLEAQILATLPPTLDRSLLLVLRESELKAKPLRAQLTACLEMAAGAAPLHVLNRLRALRLDPFDRRPAPDVLSLDDPSRKVRGALWREGNVYVLAMLASATHEAEDGANCFLQVFEAVTRALKPTDVYCSRADRIVRTPALSEVAWGFLKTVDVIHTEDGALRTDTLGARETWWDWVSDSSETRQTGTRGFQQGRGLNATSGGWQLRGAQAPHGTDRDRRDGNLVLRPSEVPTLHAAVHLWAQGLPRRDMATELLRTEGGLPPFRWEPPSPSTDPRAPRMRALALVDRVGRDLPDHALGVHVRPFATMSNDTKVLIPQRTIGDPRDFDKVKYVYAYPMPVDYFAGVDDAVLRQAVRNAALWRLGRGLPASEWLEERAYAGSLEVLAARHHWLGFDDHPERVAHLDSTFGEIIREVETQAPRTQRKPVAACPLMLPFARMPSWRGADGREFRILTTGGSRYHLVVRDPEEDSKPWGRPTRGAVLATVPAGLLHTVIADMIINALETGFDWLRQPYTLDALALSRAPRIDQLRQAEKALDRANEEAMGALRLYGETLQQLEQDPNQPLLQIQQTLLDKARNKALVAVQVAEDQCEILRADAVVAPPTPVLTSDYETIARALSRLRKLAAGAPASRVQELRRLIQAVRLYSDDPRRVIVEIDVAVPDVDGRPVLLPPLRSELTVRRGTYTTPPVAAVPLAMRLPEPILADRLAQHPATGLSTVVALAKLQADLVELGHVATPAAALAALESPVIETRIAITSGRTDVFGPALAPFVGLVQQRYRDPAFPSKGPTGYWYNASSALQEVLDHLARNGWSTSGALASALDHASRSSLQNLLRRATADGRLDRRIAPDGGFEYNVLVCDECCATRGRTQRSMVLHLPVPEVAGVLCSECLRSTQGVLYPEGYRDAVQLVRQQSFQPSTSPFKSGHRSRNR